MVRRAEIWTQRIKDLVRETPREREWLLIEAAAVVPPGRAYRQREYARKSAAQWAKLKVKPADKPSDHSTRVGARQLVSTTYNYLRRSGQIVEYEHEGETWVRFGTERKSSGEVGRATFKKMWDDMTTEEREELGRRRGEGQRQAWAGYTPEEREARKQKIREGQLRYYEERRRAKQA